MIRGWRAVAAALLLALGLGCGEDSLGPVPGTLDVVLADAPRPVGAVLFLVEGGAVDSVEAVGTYLDAAPYSGVAHQVLVAGNRLHGVIARVRVPDLRVRYAVVLQEVADDSSYALLDVAGPRLFLVASVP
ncbi:MAG: hypothetical protein KA180_02625 [Gemmatimonadales bacterium]|nr:hypothetical protein [Gemmatimonadota bacterium]MBK7350368.1 hypothetical protein [Gemmatimonadota bacterium]MBK7785511.1 hypothetical protein [Gemmatimonadota bacterium]MBP6668315.1 hypothetical protein [Gemmatimonadales bacterium]